MKKKREEDKVSKQIHELMNILDSNYFHTCIIADDKEIIEWKIYYKNLSNEIYYSDKNQAILSSNKNNVEDIYKLKSRFEELKEKEFKDNIGEFAKDHFDIYFAFLGIKEKTMDLALNIFLIYSLFNIFINVRSEDLINTILNFSICILIAIYIIISNKKLNRSKDKADSKIQEILLKNIIKRKGLDFVEELKEKMKE